ncbi:hypothetical protein H2203_002184 [Taxawa tesnikishii (nom. ined.)]|nr:hypothetical protein H2203_002184 [Dothideales sp. JES 119]
MFLPWDNKFATIDTTERPPIIIYRKEPGNTGTSMSGNMNNTPIYPTPPFVLVDGVRMFRDLGGYTAGTNRKVHRGLVFRSGDLSSMTFRGKDELTKLGIEKVFDLRSPISIDSHIIHGQEAEIDKRKDGGMTTPTEGLALADPRDPERILVDAVI